MVHASAPARIEFAGGWSDTPPYCIDHGGRVFNMAVTLDGDRPIDVWVKRIGDPVIKIVPLKGQRVIAPNDPTLWYCADLSDPSSIAKAAIIASGIELDGGLEIIFGSRLPYGSGMGTSGILGTALIAALCKLYNIENTQEGLINKGMQLEAIMTSNGGWEDQVGGCIPGMKLTESQPGEFQKLDIFRPVLVDEYELFDRCLFYYTGYTRTAKPIMEYIMVNYIRGNGDIEGILEESKKLAGVMAMCIMRRGDDFGKLLSISWSLYNKLCPLIVTDRIRAIIDKIHDFCTGYKINGAGDGGYLFMVAKDLEAVDRVKKVLTENPPNDKAKFVDVAIDNLGLMVDVSDMRDNG